MNEVSLSYSKKISSAAGLAARVALPAAVLFFSMMGVASATGGGTTSNDLGTLADNLSGVFPAFVNLIIGACYVAGMALAGAAILKFKAHKDNPTQVPLGTPIALLFIGAALLWLPSLISSTGSTVFGTSSQTTLDGPGSAWDDSGTGTGG